MWHDRGQNQAVSLPPGATPLQLGTRKINRPILMSVKIPSITREKQKEWMNQSINQSIIVRRQYVDIMVRIKRYLHQAPPYCHLVQERLIDPS
mmetsp:Transcript_10510/g.25381  ORF Transcript_10510/g.25381 Transcript_10510/m.25381 type:complete len:93 (+) Transcript_10510:667-945(+)